jgi:subtilisin family serine protease
MQPWPPVSTDKMFDGEGVLVSVVDTGWYRPAARYAECSWLARGVTGDLEKIPDTSDIRPYAGHGTFVAGVIRCVAPRAKVRVEGYLTMGGAMYESEMVKQLSQALRLGPDIISLSAGTWTRNDRRLLSFQVFWETQLRHLKGTVLVAAAGNDGQRIPFWPAAFPWSVSVGALDTDGKTRARFSNFGSWVDVNARGVDLVNAYPKGTFHYREPGHPPGSSADFDGLASWSGTSFSTPVVSGMIAARMSGKGETARQAADALLRHARTRSRRGVGARLDPVDDGSYTAPDV